MSFTTAFVYLLAAVIAVPIAQRIGLGSVLGYLLAGTVIGPFGIGLVGSEGSDVMHFAEFGVVMMLFVIGLELRPARLWQMRGPILGLGGAQVFVTAALFASIALALGFRHRMAIAIGLILALSSTAIVLQLLAEKSLMKTAGGQASFSVLLFQDMAVLPMLVILPLLATLPPAESGAHFGSTLVANLPGWQHALLVIAAIAAVILGGRFLLRPMFRFIAATKLREMFTATALLLVLGIALLMQEVGLSPALGTFLAGVVLAESEYRHQLETDIEPFKGLLLGLFFISVGASIDFALVMSEAGNVGYLVTGMLVLKVAVLLLLGRVFHLDWNQAALLALSLAQGSEFAFVLCSFATQNGVLTREVANVIVAAVALTMAVTPFLLMIYEKFLQPRVMTVLRQRDPDEIDEHDNPVILAGVGRFGHIVARFVRANGFGVTVLDFDAEQVEMLRRFGIKAFYGDATRLDMLRNAGAERAKLLVITLANQANVLKLIKTARENFPNLRILARAVSRQHAYELLRHGVNDVYRETFGSALELSGDALKVLGMQEDRVRRAAEIFREHDEASVREMAAWTGGVDGYASMARLHIENLQRALESDVGLGGRTPDGSPPAAVDQRSVT